MSDEGKPTEASTTGDGSRPVQELVRCLPQDLTPLNIKAYFFNSLGACGCSELDEMYLTLHALFVWIGEDYHDRESYEAVCGGVGLYYLVMGRLEMLGLVEHGISIRCPMLTREGERFFIALGATTIQAIDEASGEAYDGCWYDI